MNLRLRRQYAKENGGWRIRGNAPAAILLVEILFVGAFVAVHNLRSAGPAGSGQDAPSAPAYAVTPPSPAPQVPQPPVLPMAHSTSVNRAQIEQLIPTVEIWRAGSNSPQIRQRRGPQSRARITETAYLTGNLPVMLRLQFDPRAAGKLVEVTTSSGVILEQNEVALRITPSGDCVVTVRLRDGFPKGHITFSCQGLQTSVPLQQTSAGVVTRNEVAPAQ